MVGWVPVQYTNSLVHDHSFISKNRSSLSDLRTNLNIAVEVAATVFSGYTFHTFTILCEKNEAGFTILVPNFLVFTYVNW